ncbi:MAG TPA: hypothetical protein VH877_10615 [Polyangia bacterium]|nr:hypothetical protein [Polyangia bacterium]
MINQSLRRVSGDRSMAGAERLRSSRFDDVSRRLAGRNFEDVAYLGSLVCALLLALTMLW